MGFGMGDPLKIARQNGSTARLSKGQSAVEQERQAWHPQLVQESFPAPMLAPFHFTL